MELCVESERFPVANNLRVEGGGVMSSPSILCI